MKYLEFIERKIDIAPETGIVDFDRSEITPLLKPHQRDIVERLINRFSNPGEWVADPFAGLFTVPYMAVRMGRRGAGVELNPDYFRDGVGYCERADAEEET